MWEYKILLMIIQACQPHKGGWEVLMSEEEEEIELNTLGQEGWELVNFSIDSTSTEVGRLYVFKRYDPNQ